MKTIKKLLVAVLLCTTVIITASACGEKFTDDYAVLLAPSVQQQDYKTYSWNVVDNATGYVVEINGEAKGIGNPVIQSMMYGDYCEYLLDVQALGVGVHTLRFASYKFDENKGTTLSDWSKEFYVLNEIPTAIQSIEIIGEEVVIDGAFGHTVELVFNDTITATYTTPDKLPIEYQNIPLSLFEFSADLVEDINYDVKAYVINEFGKSQTYCATQFIYSLENTIAPAFGIAENGGVTFYFEEVISNPLVALKFNETEYIVALAGAYTQISSMDVITGLNIEDVKTIFETCIEQDCTFSLNVLSADGITTSSGYSNQVTIIAEGQTMVDILAMNGQVTFEDDYMVVYASVLANVFEDAVTVKASVTLDDGTVQELVAIQQSGRVSIYDYTKALGFGFNVIKVEQVVNVAEFTSTAQLYYHVNSINPQVKSVTLSNNNLNWISNGFNDGYKVQIVGVAGNVEESFETTSNYWNVNEYQGSGSFNVKVIPLLNGTEGTASPLLKINKISAPSANLITEEAERIIVKGLDANDLKVEVYQTNSTINLVQSRILYSSTDVMYISKSNLYNYGTFEIRLKRLGNGINTVDSNETVAKFAVSDCLTFDVKDGEYVKISGIEQDEMFIDGKAIDETYFEEDWFDIKAYYLAQLENYTANGRVVIGSKLSSISSETVNVIVKELTFNMESTEYIAEAPQSIFYDSAEQIFRWTGSEYNEYVYEIRDNSNDSLKTSGSTTGTELFVSSLLKGKYTIKIKLLGNGQILNSFWKEFTFEVLTKSSVSTQTDFANNKTRLYVTTTSDNLEPVLYTSSDRYYSYTRYDGENSNEHYFLLNSDFASNDPYLTYEYSFDGCDYHTDLETISDTVELVSYQLYYYDVYNDGNSYRSFYQLKGVSSAQEFLRPVLVTNYDGKNVLGSKPVESTYTTSYDYRYDYVIDSGFTKTATITKDGSNFDNDYFLVTFDYTNALGFEGVDASKYYANILEEKVIVDYAYVLSKTALKDYLETYVPLDDGYAYYIDAECTILLDSTVEIDGAITIYVGLAQA